MGEGVPESEWVGGYTDSEGPTDDVLLGSWWKGGPVDGPLGRMSGGWASGSRRVGGRADDGGRRADGGLWVEAAPQPR